MGCREELVGEVEHPVELDRIGEEAQDISSLPSDHVSKVVPDLTLIPPVARIRVGNSSAFTTALIDV